MQPRRSNLLLLLLVLTPLALLAWLGTYLIRDAARSTDSAMQTVLKERLAAADYQLQEEMRQLTDELDHTEPHVVSREAARALGAWDWVVEAWTFEPLVGLELVVDKNQHVPASGDDAKSRAEALMELLKRPASRAMDPTQTFHPIQRGEPDRSRQTVWQTFARNHNQAGEGWRLARTKVSFTSGWHVTDGDFIYWRRGSEGGLVCARLNSRLVREALYQKLRPAQSVDYPGRMMLATQSGIPLHKTGKELWGAGQEAVARLACSAPLVQWTLAYSPASDEFPQPYLFPILLGVGSGCLLVMALAWTFSRENERELRLAQQRVSFVNQISHELKTPLTNIQLYTEMAAHRVEESGDGIARKHLRVVETETSRLNRLIQNVLNYARQQRDRLGVHPQVIELDEVVARAVDHWRLLLVGKGIEVHTHFSGPGKLKADPDAIEQILGNLISNVDKYASHGKWVSIRTEAGPWGAQIIVEDRGPGIPAGKRRQIFEPFERLRSDLNEGVSGTGIGLTISRELAELHGGSLEVCANCKEGARFILTLPDLPS